MQKLYKFISYTFHPVIFPTVGTLLHFILVPGNYIQFQLIWLLAVFMLTYISPIIYLLILKKLKLITSIKLESTNERKLPLIFLSINFLILLYTLSIFNQYTLLKLFYSGSFFAIIISYVLLFKNIKASLHTIAISGLISYILIVSATYNINLLLIIIICVILSGFIGTSRLVLNAHTRKEVYLGYLVGINSQILAYIFYSI